MLKTIEIRSLLAVALLLLAILLALVGLGGMYGIRSTNDALSSASDNVPTVMAVLAQQEDIARARLRLDRLAAVQDTTVFESTLGSAQALIGDSDRAWAEYTAFPSGEDEKRIAGDVARARDQILKSGFEPLIAALKSSDTETARALAFVTLPKLYAQFSDATTKLSQFQAEDSARLADEGKSHERTTMTLTIASTLIGVLCAFGSWVVLRDALSKPLAAATRHFGRDRSWRPYEQHCVRATMNWARCCAVSPECSGVYATPS
jgi:methyl-accepting chemotaxis protein-1 (serine sensor receptor)